MDNKIKGANIHENNLYTTKKIIYKIINLLCDSTKCLDNIYYKFCEIYFSGSSKINSSKSATILAG